MKLKLIILRLALDAGIESGIHLDSTFWSARSAGFEMMLALLGYVSCDAAHRQLLQPA